MEEPKETQARQQPEHCPYCGRVLEPGQPCRCPQARMMAVLRETEDPAQPEANLIEPAAGQTGQRENEAPARPGPNPIGPAIETGQAEREPPEPEEEQRPFRTWQEALFAQDKPRGEDQPARVFQLPEDFPFEELDDFDEDELEEWELDDFSPQAIFHQAVSQVFSPFRNFFPFFAAYFRAPMRATEAACRGRDLPLALLYLLTFLASGGGFFLALTHRCGALLVQALGALFALAPFELPDPRRLHIQVKDGRCFFYGALILLCLVLLAALAVCLSCRLAKVRLGLCRSLILCSVSGLWPSLLLLGASASLAVAPGLALGLAALAALVYAALVFHAACQAAAFPEKGSFYLVLALLLFLAFALAARFGARLLRPSLEHLLHRLFS